MRIADDLPEPIFRKLRYQKDIDGYGDKSWTDWFRFKTKDVALDKPIGELLGDATRDQLAMLWMKNFAQNLGTILTGGDPLTPNPQLQNRIWQLPKIKTPALVVGAGPSIKTKNHLELLKDWIDDDLHRRDLLTIFSTDRMLLPLLEHEIRPDYVVSVDGNAEKIPQWYWGDLFEKWGEGIKAILAATVSPEVVKICVKAGIKPYFFVAMLDQFTLTNNITRLMHFMVDATAINCGGNAGSSAWAVANYLDAPEIALIGMDYGYLKGTPIEETAYYGALKDRAKSANEIFALYFNDHNPDFEVDCYSDIMFGYYREAFLNMIDLARAVRPLETVNCTEGGILHASNLKAMKFKDWLPRLARKLETPIAAT